MKKLTNLFLLMTVLITVLTLSCPSVTEDEKSGGGSGNPLIGTWLVISCTYDEQNVLGNAFEFYQDKTGLGHFDGGAKATFKYSLSTTTYGNLLTITDCIYGGGLAAGYWRYEILTPSGNLKCNEAFSSGALAPNGVETILEKWTQ